MADVVEIFRNSLIQHGRENDRVYLMKLADADMPELVPDLVRFARESGYGKIFAKAERSHLESFLEAGFRQEGTIPQFYRVRHDAVFLGYYLDPERGQEQRQQLVKEVLELAEQKARPQQPVPLPTELSCRIAWPEDAEAMAELYKIVFASYPFPVHDPAYLRQTMEENLLYFGVWEGERLIGLASAEMDLAAGNAEMTDFATLPECRGHGIAQHLLQEMEAAMVKRDILSLYTIARAYSHGMNITFAKHGYRYAGTLTNNTNICGTLESMNLWYKQLAKD